MPFLLILLLSSCVTWNQKIQILPLETKTPVSASDFLYHQGQILRPENFSSVEPFEFDLTISPKISEPEVNLKLTDELEKRLTAVGGFGITSLKIHFLQMNDWTHPAVSIERTVGGTVLLLGGALTATGVAYMLSPTVKGGDQILLPGIVLDLIGASLIGASVWHESVGTVDYVVRISGNIVKKSN